MKSKLAIWSLVLSLLIPSILVIWMSITPQVIPYKGLPILQYLLFILELIVLLSGVIALVFIKKKNLTGKWQAIASIIIVVFEIVYTINLVSGGAFGVPIGGPFPL